MQTNMLHPSPTSSILQRLSSWLIALAIVVTALPALGAVESLNTKQLVAKVQQEAVAGFCAHLGCGDGQLTADLARNERLAIHALAASDTDVAKARALLQERELYGQAVVEHWADSFLPYADNLINVVVAENPGEISEDEMMRVLVPNGLLCVKQEGLWRCVRKPWPREFDEWTHWRHAADGNMVSRDTAIQTPTGLRWIGGPPQDPGGRKWYYDHVLVSSAGRNFYVYEEEIVARDAFNGRLLWKLPAKAYTFKEAGLTVLGMKVGNRTSKVRPVALGDFLYVAMDGELVVLHGATGALAKKICRVHVPREIAISEGILLVSDQNALRAFNLNGEPCWQYRGAARRVVAGERNLFLLPLTGSEIVCLDLFTGSERWRIQHPKAAEAQTCAYYEKVFVLERSVLRDDAAGSGVVVFDANTGEELWSKDYKPGMTHFKESRTFFADDLIWLETLSPTKGVRWLGLDPKTGEQSKDLGGRGLHCSAPVATENFLITAEMEFTDISSGKQSRGRMVKGACRLPFIPANGLLYSFPVQCECFPMLRGYMGLANTPPATESSRPRLQPGPGYGISPATTAKPSADDWPMYRHDGYRSGSTSVELPTDLQQLWSLQLESSPTNLLGHDWKNDPFADGPITAPVCLSDTLVIATPHRHSVTALDAKTGKKRWTFVAGGRVDTPPSLFQDLCLFGSHDGYVYCLRTSDGALVWRFRAAPYESRIAVYGQMESSWPVAGNVLVHQDLAYFAAGRHPLSDGGVRVCAVNARDGKLAWEKILTDSGVKNWYSGFLPNTKIKVGVDYEPVDMLVRDGDKIAMSRWRFAPDTGDMELAFTNTTYLAHDTLQVPRGVWGYGIRQTKLVFEKPPVAFSNEKAVSRPLPMTSLCSWLAICWSPPPARAS